jgi:hypothetical protein
MGSKYILMKFKRYLSFLAFLFLLYSCNYSVKNGNVYVFPRDTIAILPFDNLSNDITAETMLREMLYKGLKAKGWDVLDSSYVDEKLKSIGITDGGQLNSVSVKKLKELLGVKYLCYGTINDFKLQNIGYVINKVVELNIKIVDTDNEKIIFDETGIGRDFKVFLKSDEAKKAFIEYNALKLVENVIKRPLYNEAKKAVDTILLKIP